MKILLTAPSQTGKSTVVCNVKKLFDDNLMRGIWSRENTLNGRRVGFSSILSDGTEQEFMSKFNYDNTASSDLMYSIGSYRVDVGVIDQFVASELEECCAEANKIIYVDEIGRAQAFSERFMIATKNLFDSEKTVLATIVYEDEPWSMHFKQHPDAWVITLTVDNRDYLPGIIGAMCRNVGLFNKLECNQRTQLKNTFFVLLSSGQYISAKKLFENTLHYITEMRVERASSPGRCTKKSQLKFC
jgi:nucleoside-triphosphatase THEP1